MIQIIILLKKYDLNFFELHQEYLNDQKYKQEKHTMNFGFELTEIGQLMEIKNLFKKRLRNLRTNSNNLFISSKYFTAHMDYFKQIEF